MKIQLNDITLLLLHHSILSLMKGSTDPKLKKELKSMKKKTSGVQHYTSVNETESVFLSNILKYCIEEVKKVPDAGKILGLTKDEILNKMTEDSNKLKKEN